MSVGVQHPGLFRFSCVAAAASLLVIPAIHVMGSLIAGADHALHDTYYFTANAQVLALLTALVVCHLTVAAACAVLAVGTTGGYVAGWFLALSAVLMSAAQAVPSLVMLLTPIPTRYVDYVETPQIAFWIFDAGAYASMVAVVGMAVGWVILAVSARHKQAGTR
jgi:hypothetical protein